MTEPIEGQRRQNASNAKKYIKGKGKPNIINRVIHLQLQLDTDTVEKQCYYSNNKDYQFDSQQCLTQIPHTDTP